METRVEKTRMLLRRRRAEIERKKKTLQEKKTLTGCIASLLAPQRTPSTLSPSFLRARITRRGSASAIRGGVEGEEREVKRRARARKKTRKTDGRRGVGRGGRRAKQAVEFRHAVAIRPRGIFPRDSVRSHRTRCRRRHSRARVPRKKERRERETHLETTRAEGRR